MTRRDAFCECHPIVNFIFFVFVIGIAIFSKHPVYMLLSMIAAILYAVCYQGRRAFRVMMGFFVPMFLLAAIINPLFSHAGVTILCYFPNGNPFTLESVVFGIAAGLMIGNCVLWFHCFHHVMTSDKLLFLTGGLFPSTALVISMALRFVPEFIRQLGKIREAQICIGMDWSEGNIVHRLTCGAKILSILTTWAFEHSIEKADSMTSRGYGLKGRRSYNRFPFNRQDGILIVALLLLGGLQVYLFASRTIFMWYYPMIQMNANGFVSIIAYICFGILCFMPMELNLLEEIRWTRLRSNI